jgi:hypothetical protein
MEILLLLSVNLSTDRIIDCARGNLVTLFFFFQFSTSKLQKYTSKLQNYACTIYTSQDDSVPRISEANA